MITSKKFTPFLLLVAFSLVFIIEWYTPIHSDDYRYSLLGLSFESHLHHYMTWSGRVVADLVSSLILTTNSRFFYACITGLVVVAFCYLIVKTPARSFRLHKNDVLLFPLIFLSYWISNPNLGQTTFWIVGSANYLWTNLFAAAWIWGMYRICVENITATKWYMVALSLFAGCSTESIGPFIVALAALAVVYDAWFHKTVILSKLLYLCASIAGALVLIFSPGNFIRASGETHQVWYQKPLTERIAYHLTERFFSHQALIWIGWVVLVLLGILAFVCIKRNVTLSRVKTVMMWLMVCVGIGTSLIMFASPTYPDRVMNGTFMFLLFAIAFLASNLLDTRQRVANCGVAAIVLILVGVFIWSYSLMLTAYKRVWQQDQVRLQIIAHEIAGQQRIFTIPDFHFNKLQNSGGHFGFFHDPLVYGEYFGADNIDKVKVGFDYSVLATGNKQILNDAVTAWFNADGDIMLVSNAPLEGTVEISSAGKRYILPVVQFKQATINQAYWYYHSVSDKTIKAIALVP